jgi:serum/glucocorticoid-regulated kinase 2
MAKILRDGEETNSFCGTAEYLAPEIITGEGHNRMADWWSYGTLIYEMLFGIPPFFSQNVEKMYEFITKSELKFPKKFEVSDDVKDFLSKLLIKNPKERFGAHGGFEEIQKHPFFKDIDFKALEEKKIKAPFKPELKDSFDVRNFDEEFTSEDLSNSQINEKEMDLIQKNQEKFDEFDDDEDD